ncbi:MAG: 50S ribosomal protein L24 [Candidatus Levyibacteriota bacterium]
MKKSYKLQVISYKLRKGDEVKVVLGKDKGKSGKIEKVFSKKGLILIAGINQYKRHLKARAQNQKSEIITITKPMSITNVVLVCPKCHLATRVGFSIEKDKKLRICKKCKQTI